MGIAAMDQIDSTQPEKLFTTRSAANMIQNLFFDPQVSEVKLVAKNS